jgi:hypothetical protein
MTAKGAADSEISEILRHVEQQLRSNEKMRQELASAVLQKDESAVRRVAAALWKGLKVVAPIALSAVLAWFGIPSF